MKTSMTTPAAVFLFLLLGTAGTVVSAFERPRPVRLWRRVTERNFPKFVVTTIDVEKLDGNKVRFHGRMKGKPDTEPASIITDIKLVDDKKKVYEGTELPLSEFQPELNRRGRARRKRLPKAFPYVHGYNTQPEDVFEGLKLSGLYSQEEKIGTVIAVLWATTTSFAGYKKDKASAEAAGKSFRTLLDCLRPLREKNLMCHSMGNFVLKWASPKADSPESFAETERFKSIFMVAADTSFDIFYTDREDRGFPDGIPLAAMAERVHVLFANNDDALKWRVPFNGFVKALGREGIDDTKVDSEVREKLVVPAKDCSTFSDREDPRWSHSYQFDSECIKYYMANIE